MKKQYVVRKYVMAENVADALKKEVLVKADEAWIDEDWKKNHELCEEIKGFKHNENSSNTRRRKR